MGNGTSSSDADDYFGFRVKEIRKLSPAAKSGLISNSDYVLSANGKTLKNMESTAIAELIRVSKNLYCIHIPESH